MRFNEEKHIYTNDEGEQYLSVTSFVKKFVKPFDKMKVAKKYAKKRKLSVEDVLADWEKAGQDAINKGTKYHKLQEDFLLNLGFMVLDNTEYPIVPCTYEGSDKVSSKLTLEPGIYPELCVWSDKYKLAGQADYVEITKNNKINIVDYKTSKEIRTQGYEKWDGTTEKMLFPLQNLDDCNFNHYALQLNLYAFMIKQHNRNLEIGKLSIQHVTGEIDENDIFIISESMRYDVPNLQKEVKIVLEYHKSHK
jgi:hypothetical protein